MSEVTYVVVGAGRAAASAVESLRAEGVEGRVVLIGDEPHLPYERPELSKGYLAGEKSRDDLNVHDQKWYDANDVELLLGRQATGIEPGSRTVHLDGAGDQQRIGYDRLLLATGSGPRPLDLPGAELEGVHYLRQVGDSDGIRQAIERGGPLVVIGGGWIGLETAAVARTKGLDVTVLETQSSPLSRVVGDEIGQRFAALHRDHGVTVLTGVQVARITGGTGGSGGTGGGGGTGVDGVELVDGTKLPAAAVIAGVGAAPRIELAEAAGLTIAGGGVAVNAHLISSDERIWAAGDIAYAQNAWLGGPVRVEHIANAGDQGAFAGRSLAGSEADWDVAPFFYSDQYDTGLEYHGWADPRDSRLVVRELGEGAWTAFWLDDGRVCAGMHVNGWDDADAVKALVLDKAVVDAGRLADPQVDWAAARE